MSRATFRAVVLILVSMGMVVLTFGQTEITGRVAGVVSDASRALIPGVTVTVEGPTLFAPQTAVTSDDGRYFIDKLPIGTYKVSFSLPGFKRLIQNDVAVRANFTATINVTMEVGTLEEQLVVSESSPVVDVSSATLATTFDSEYLKEIPHGRDTWSMLAQVPGLAPAKFDIGGTESFQQTATQMRGSTGQTVYNINGLNLNWPGGNASATAFYFDNDSFQEVQVVTGAAQAEIGVGGVQINMITRQGTNDLRGQAAMFYTTSGLTSEPNFPVFAGRPVESGTKITMMRDGNIQLGLPVIKDRLWFYSSFREYHINLAVPAVKRLDGSAIQDTNLQRDVTSRADIALTNRQKLTLNWLYNDINRYYRPGSGFVDDVATGLQLEHAWVGQAQWSYTPTSNLVLESRLGNMTLHFPQDYQPQVKPGTIAVIDTVLNTTKYARPGGATLNFTWHTRGTQNLSYFKSRWLGGSHNMRAGYEYARMSNGNQVYIYRDLNVRLSNGSPLDAQLFNTPRKSFEESHESALFFQDSFVIKRLTINGGLRYDHFLTFLPAQSSPAGSFYPERSFARSKNIVKWNNASPRVGVAYDVTGKGRAVIRGGFNRFVALEGSRLAAALNPNSAVTCTYTFTSLAADNYPLGLSATPVSCTGGVFTSVDPGLTRPYGQGFSVGYEQQIVSNLRASVNYFHGSAKNPFSRVNRAALRSDYAPLSVTNPLTNEPLTIYNLAASKRNLQDFLIRNAPEVDENAYNGFEIEARKQMTQNWQVLGGFTVQRKKGTIFNETGDDLNDPNRDIYRNNANLDNDPTYMFKLAGTYNLPFGITTSGNFQHYTGYPFTPQALFRAGTSAGGGVVSLTQNSVTVPLIRRGDQRLPNVNVFNMRFGYKRNFGDRYRIEPAMDLYNVFNKGTITGMVPDIGSGSSAGVFTLSTSFKRPQTNLSQRFVKFGLRFEF